MPTSTAKTTMLSSSIGQADGNASVTINNIESCTYDVYAYTFHNGAEANEESYLVRIEGNSIRNSANPASPWSPGTWERVGPVRVTVTDGDIQVFIIGALCGLEVYRVTQAELPPPVVDAGLDVTLVDYTTSAVLQGQVQESYQRIVGWKSYELKDHLGNIRVVVGDEKLATLNGATLGLRAAIRSYANYYPFGMNAPGGNWSAGSKYRYGFNGKEQDKEWEKIDFGARAYDARIARFTASDPLAGNYPWQSPFVYAANNPIRFIDVNGESTGDPPLFHFQIQNMAKKLKLNANTPKNEIFRTQMKIMGYVMEELYLKAIQADPIAKNHVERAEYPNWFLENFLGIRKYKLGVVPDAVAVGGYDERDKNGEIENRILVPFNVFIDVKTRQTISPLDDDSQLLLLMAQAAIQFRDVFDYYSGKKVKTIRASDVGAATVILVVPADVEFTRNPETGKELLREAAEHLKVNVFLVHMTYDPKTEQFGFTQPKEYYMSPLGRSNEDMVKRKHKEMTPKNVQTDKDVFRKAYDRANK